MKCLTFFGKEKHKRKSGKFFSYGKDKMKFGTPDVLLTLMTEEPNEQDCTLHLHSQVLSKSDYFKARLSETWNLEPQKKPVEICLKNCKDPANYVRCLEMLYEAEKGKNFSSIEEALGILEIASLLLCQECIDCCLTYLEAVPWNSEQEFAIRSCISTLQLTPSTDLALRLLPSAWNPAQVALTMLPQLIKSSNFKSSKSRSLFNNMTQHLQHAGFVEVIETNLLQDLKHHVRGLKQSELKTCSFRSFDSYFKLTWLLHQFNRCNIAATAIKIFAEDREFVKKVLSDTRICQETVHHCFSCHRPDFVKELSFLFENVSDGKVVLSRAVRKGLVTTWFPFLVKSCEYYPPSDKYVIWFEKVVKSLPMEDQRIIFKLWIDSGPCDSKVLSRLFSGWC